MDELVLVSLLRFTVGCFYSAFIVVHSLVLCAG